MRVFITVLVLIFSLQSWTKADDISEFEIEGMSIGDSALDYFSEDEISKATDESAKDKIFLVKTFFTKNSNLYEVVQISYKRSDQKKVIHGIGGVVDFPNNINKCKKEMKKIVSKLSILFPNTTKKEWGKYNMPTGEGHYFPVTFDFRDLSRAMVSCQDWNKKSGLVDNLKVSLFSSEYSEYLKKQNR